LSSRPTCSFRYASPCLDLNTGKPLPEKRWDIATPDRCIALSGREITETRYAAGTREILESYFAGVPIREEYLIVDKGVLAGAGAHSYTPGDTTSGLDVAA
jgi:hypothetical protein